MPSLEPAADRLKTLTERSKQTALQPNLVRLKLRIESALPAKAGLALRPIDKRQLRQSHALQPEATFQNAPIINRRLNPQNALAPRGYQQSAKQAIACSDLAYPAY